MSDIYTRNFVLYYDMRAELLIRNVDQEIDFFEFVFTKFAGTPVKKILDVACGTGRHYIPLMQKGYEVKGVDLSQNMLNILRKKADGLALKPDIFRKDMRDIDFADEFHAIICMNSAFQYLLTDDDILKTLRMFHKSLEYRGVVIIDMMNFLSLLGRYKENIIRNYSVDGIKIKQAIEHSVDNVSAIWNHREFGIIEKEGETFTYEELHRFRMLNYNEISNLLGEAGFSEIRCFGEFTAREEAKENAKRLILVAVKQEG
jgi:SAM-dependent methyltransferase